MLEFVLYFVLLVVALGGIMLLAGRDPKPRKRRFKGMSGALGVFNELYNPSAQSATQIVEEQAKARKQTGNEDKKKPQSK
jgi:hypothetical protein